MLEKCGAGPVTALIVLITSAAWALAWGAVLLLFSITSEELKGITITIGPIRL